MSVAIAKDPRKCDECGTEVEEGDKWCQNCHAPLGNHDDVILGP